MGFDRYAGRKCPNGGADFPQGCSALSDNTLAWCQANMRGKACLICQRDGDVPMPRKWERAAYNIAGKRSVQIVSIGGRPPVWVVVCFVGGFLVDSRKPPIACASLDQAVEIAFIRARQIEPFAPIEKRGPGDWWVGSVMVWTVACD